MRLQDGSFYLLVIMYERFLKYGMSRRIQLINVIHDLYLISIVVG